MKKKVSKVQILRALSQLAFLFVLPALVGLAFGEIKLLYTSIADGTFTVTGFAGRFAFLIALVPLTILLGRFFCGWICAFGALNDFIYAVSRKVFRTGFKVSPRWDRVLKCTKYVLLAFIIVVQWTIGNAAFGQLSPWDAFTSIPDIPESVSDNPIGFIVLALVVVGACFVERFFCRYICPLGAVLALSSMPRLFQISKPGAQCGKCRICTNHCAMGIQLYRTDKVTSGECIFCFKCTDACPRNNAQARFCGEVVNPKLAGAVVIAAYTGIHTAANTMDGFSSYAHQQDYSVPAASPLERTEPSVAPNPTKENSALPTSGSQTNAAKYKDGTYTGTARGYKPDLTVSVTVLNGQISQIKILSHNESRGFYEKPFNSVPQQIISKQSTKVDAISGATRSSEGIMNAVANALLKARA